MKKFVTAMIVGSVLTVAAAPAHAQGVPVPSARAIEDALARTDSSVLTDARLDLAQAMPSQIGTAPPSGKVLMWTGAGLFAGGMAVGIYGFLNNSNGQYPGFGEAEATNTRIGAAGLTTAFAGGTLMYFGYRMSRRVANVQVTPDRFAVSKSVSW